MFYIKEDQVGSYEDLWAEEVLADVVKGQPVLINDTFCFYMTGGYAAVAGVREADRVTPIWRCKQVLADKVTGSGNDIQRGERVYYIVAGANAGLVTANLPAGVIGTDYYYCGIAKETTDEDDEQVWMSFDGSSYDDPDKML
jgi:hypothetical protein